MNTDQSNNYCLLKGRHSDGPHEFQGCSSQKCSRGGWGEVGHGGVEWVMWGGVGGVSHGGVGWGQSCRGELGHVGWGGSCMGGVGHVGVGWVM